MHFHGQRGLFRFLASQPRFEISLKNCKFTLRLKQSTFTFENYFQLGRFDFLRSVYFKYYQKKKKNWEINFSREISNVSIIVILTHGRILDMIAFDCFEQIQQICMQRWTDIYIYIFIIELIIYLRISFLFFPPRPEDRFKKEETAEKRRVKKKSLPKGIFQLALHEASLVSKDKRVFEQSSTILYPSWRYAKHELEERKRVPKISSE